MRGKGQTASVCPGGGVVMTGAHCRSGLTGNSDSLLSSVLFASTILAAACAFVLPGTLRAQPQEKAQASTQPPGQASAQVPAKPAEQKPEVSESTTELKTQDTKGTLKVRVNLVVVRVVVRDDKGRAVGTLHEEDFKLFDNKKPQIISHFAVETPATELAKVVKPDNAAGDSGGPDGGAALTMPQRYVGYLFDDVHLAFEDLARARDAADHQITAAGQPGDRAGIYTTSGQTTLDFTDDRAKLHDTLQKLRPHPVGRSGVRECPDVSYYMADLIENQHDAQALQVATADALACAFGNDSRFLQQAQQLAEGTAQRMLSVGDAETQYSLRLLAEIVRRMTLLPGQRSMILISPGFLITDRQSQVSEILDRAVRANIVVNSVDARGLYASPPGGDISQGGGFTNDAAVGAHQDTYRLQEASAQADPMAELADGTGGTFFHNNNDLEEGFRRVAAAPEVFYVLGFSPQNLKFDGKYHTLKVALTNRQKFSVQARRGYVAPKHMVDPAEQAKQEIEEAVFSQDELHDLPVELHTQFFKASDTGAKLTVLTHVDLSQIRFRKADGRNWNNLTVVAALFDRNGNLIIGSQKVVEMRLLDTTLERMGRRGITLKTSFDVKPGAYLVRLVVRDSEAELITAQNGAVEIPY
jgi:VWFA-related protein